MKKRTLNIKATKKNLNKMFMERGLSYRQVQESLGLESVQSIYKWVNLSNNTLPRIKKLVPLSGLLGCDINDILSIEEESV